MFACVTDQMVTQMLFNRQVSFLFPVLGVLNEMFGEDLVKKGGKIVRFQQSKFVTDAFSLGASSYPKVGKCHNLLSCEN